SGQKLSYLFFADDLVILDRAELEQAKLRVDDANGGRICGVFGFCQVQNLSSYLGVPLFHEKITNISLRFMVKKVKVKLQGWDARQLSLVGKITLAQLVLLAIPKYFMQSLMIPKGIFEEIKRIIRQFIWGNLRVGRRLNTLLDSSYGETLEQEMVTVNGSWNLELFRLWLPEEIIDQITSILTLNPLASQDRNCHNLVIRGVEWLIFFGLVAWRIWKNKNLHIFQGSLWSVEENIKSSLSWAKQYVCLPKGSIEKRSGEWIMGFNRRLDNLEVIEAIRESTRSPLTLIRHIQHYLKTIDHLLLQYIPRDENLEANQIAKLAFDREEGL
ncbi:hypothetical protein Golax_022850, partial [Gossypium laxum]|nr:hypothetical protein [Gossypium laxum]